MENYAASSNHIDEPELTVDVKPCINEIALTEPPVKKKKPTPRKYWVHPLNVKRMEEGQFHVMFNKLRAEPDKFFDYYQMSIESFDELLESVRYAIGKKDTNLRWSITPEERLTVTLRYLVIGCSFSVLRTDFLMGTTTIRDIVQEGCITIWDTLEETEVPQLSPQDWRDIALGFYENTGIPHCLGAIAAKHIRIISPKHNSSLFVLKKNRYSIAFIVVCDSNYCFRAIEVQTNGTDGDASVVKNSEIARKIREGGIKLPEAERMPNDESGEPQPFFFIGDETFPMTDNVIRPFGRHPLDEKKLFNDKLAEISKYAEQCLHMLCTKFKIFQAPLLVYPEFASDIFKATCALHNYIRLKDGVNLTEMTPSPFIPVCRTGCRKPPNMGKHIRDYVVDYVKNNADKG